MNTGISASDKKMLLGLALILIIVGIGWWGIRPAVQKTSKIETEIQDQQSEKRLNQQKISQLPILEKDCQDYQEKIDKYQKQFYQTMKSDEIDKMLTTKALGLGLTCYDLSIDMPTAPSDRQAYQYSDLYAQQQITAMANAAQEAEAEQESAADGESEDTEEETQTSYGQNTDIYAVSVQMTLGGKKEDLRKFIDNLNASDKRILVKSFQWGEIQEAEGSGTTSDSGSSDVISADAASAGDALNLKVEKTLTISLEIYMNQGTANIGDYLNEDGE